MDEFDEREKEFWRQLEVLSLAYISEQLHHALPKDAALTKERKDGGFDGKIVIQISPGLGINHTILMESKFRTSIKTLPLNDCSKALIIAFNRAVQTLFIITNIKFSPQAKQEIENFKKKVNLNVIEVDGDMLREFISINNEQLQLQCSYEFLNYFFDPKKVDLDFTITSAPKKIQKTKKVVSREIILRDETYKNDQKYLLNIFKTSGMFGIIQGEPGTGKSIFLVELLENLNKKGKIFYIFDLQQYSSPRILFIKILEALWGIDLSEFLIQSIQDKQIKELNALLEYTADGMIPNEQLSTIIQMICMKNNGIKGYSDTYYYLLSEYIYKLLQPYQGCNNLLFAFTNFNKAELETIQFLYTLLCRITGIISIILEMRPYFILENTTDDLIETNYYQKFLSLSNSKHVVTRNDFSPEEALKYLESQIQGLPDENKQEFVQRTGTNPLYLSLGTSYLKAEIDILGLHANSIPVFIWKNLLDRLSVDSDNFILNCLSYYCIDKDIEICLIAASFLNGILPLELIKRIFLPKQIDKLFNLLDEIPYFIFQDNAYCIKHNLIYDAIHKRTSERKKSIVATKILKYLQEPDFSFYVAKDLVFNLLFYANKYEKALTLWRDLVVDFHTGHQYFTIIKSGKTALLCYERLDYDKKDTFLQTYIVKTILQAYIDIRVLDTSDFNKLLKQFETICSLNKYTKNGKELRARYLFFKWNKEFYSGRIEDSYLSIVEAKALVDNKLIDDDTLCGYISWGYALSHKRKTSISHAISDYEESLKLYPDSSILQIGLGLHQAHIYLRVQPKKTIDICEDLLCKVHNMDCPYHEVLQIRIDIIAAKFYAQDYGKALNDGLEVLKIAKSVNAAYQIGRILNICGACKWMLNQEEDALADFQKSYYEFKESGNFLFEWRALFNLAQILMSYNKKQSLKIYMYLFKKGIPNIEERALHLDFENAEMVGYLHTVRVLKKHRLYKDNHTTNLLLKNDVYLNYIDADENTFFQALKKLSYIHQGFIVILG